MENGWDYLLFQGGKIVPVQESEPSFAGGKEKGRAEVSENIRPGKVNSRVPDDGLPKTVLFPADHRDSRLGHGSRRGRSDPVDEISSREYRGLRRARAGELPGIPFQRGAVVPSGKCPGGPARVGDLGRLGKPGGPGTVSCIGLAPGGVFL